MIEEIRYSLQDAQNSLNRLISNEAVLIEIESAAKIIIDSLQSGNRLFSCGNGGSMCDAMHFAEELTGRYRKNRKAYPAIAIADSSHMSCVANDFGYDFVFSRYIEAHGKKGDCLIGITTSGASQTIFNAVKVASSMGMKPIVLSGKVNPELKMLSRAYICTPAGRFADRVQELHIKVLHIFIEMIERHFHPENY